MSSDEAVRFWHTPLANPSNNCVAAASGKEIYFCPIPRLDKAWAQTHSALLEVRPNTVHKFLLYTLSYYDPASDLGRDINVFQSQDYTESSRTDNQHAHQSPLNQLCSLTFPFSQVHPALAAFDNSRSLLTALIPPSPPLLNIVPLLHMGLECVVACHWSLWMPNGSPRHFLAKHNHNLCVGHRLQFVPLDIENGLQYLQSIPIVHGDLSGVELLVHAVSDGKQNNVLIDEDHAARLIDFGYASVVGDVPEACSYLQRSTTRPGSSRRVSPEQITEEEAFTRTTRTYMHSFGSVALQESPAFDLNDERIYSASLAGSVWKATVIRNPTRCGRHPSHSKGP